MFFRNRISACSIRFSDHRAVFYPKGMDLRESTDSENILLLLASNVTYPANHLVMC